MAVLLPRYPIPGYEDISPEEAAEMLHQEKNRPEGPPSAVLRKVTRAVSELTPEERAFPVALYREWIPTDKTKARARAAARLQMDVNKVLELEYIDQFIGAYDSVLVRNQADRDIMKGQGWADSPDDAKALAFDSHRELATSAAISNHDDRRMGEMARAHREAVEDAADDHVAEIPQTPKKPRGRPRKS